MSIDPTTLRHRKTLCRKCICQADFSDPCATCAKGRWHRVPDCHTAPTARPMPTLKTMITTAAGSAMDEAKAILAGVPAVSDEQIAARLAICSACPDYLADSARCSHCRCFLKFKTALRTAHCPVGKW